MRILVTGGAGYIGSHTVVALLEAGHQVAVLDNLSNSDIAVINRVKQITGKSPAFFKADVRDGSALGNIFSHFRPEAVIHFAGLKAVGESVQQPLRYYEWNVGGSVALFQAMDQAGVRTLIFSSSATVYGDPKEVPIPENAPIAPTSPYGHSKAMIEQVLADVAAANPEWRIARLRYFNPVGAHESGLIGESPNDVPNNLMPYISQVAVGKLNELRIFGGDYATEDGTGVRDYIHVMDLAQGHMAALDFLEGQTGLHTINLGTGRGCSVLEIVKAFEKASGQHVPYRIVERRPGDVALCFSDPSEAERLLGWKARYSLEDMCRDAWRWQSMNPDGYGTEP
ncbi:UDP-glucose 4-epimerase [mine drainage metagenome]|uniref:UDP-glucose 4-epimerase n=1 Tax=mine drainage metagenome TaxID=410659 RepID=A0A1J5RG50_9ZZZZ